MKWLKRVGLSLLVCLFLLSSPTYAQNEGYAQSKGYPLIVLPVIPEKLKKIAGKKLQVENKTHKLKIVKPEDRETVTVELNMDGVGKPIKRTKILSTLREEINKQKNGEERREIEIQIMIDDEIGLSQEEFVKKYADIFKDSYVDLSKRQANFFAKLNIEQIEALEKLDEVKYLSKIDDVLEICI